MKHKRSYQRPPLPYIGSKLRWWRELQALAQKLPHGGCVFDAFGGSFSAARVIKDTRPDLTVIVNDYNHDYRRRLDVAPQTVAVYERLVEAVGHRPRDRTIWDKFKSKEEKDLAISIVDTADDSVTAWNWLYGKSYPMNMIPINCPVCPSACDDWTKGLVIIDDIMSAYEAKYWAESGAFVILDPPYLGSIKMGYQAESYYQGGRIDAHAFCVELMNLCNNWCLFDRPESPFVQHAKEKGAIEIRRAGKRNHLRVNEVLMVCAAYGAMAT